MGKTSDLEEEIARRHSHRPNGIVTPPCNVEPVQLEIALYDTEYKPDKQNLNLPASAVNRTMHSQPEDEIEYFHTFPVKRRKPTVIQDYLVAYRKHLKDIS